MRLATLAIAAAVLSGCGGVRVTSPPPATAAPPTRTPTAEPTGVVTPEPPATCPPTPSTAELALQTGPGTELIPLVDEPLPSPTVEDPASVPVVATVLGGIEHVATLTLDDATDAALTISDASAEYLPFGSMTPLRVTATTDGAAVAFVLPDSTLAGQLRVAVTWSGSCGSGAGTGTIGLAVAKAAVAAGCPETPEDFNAEVVKLTDLEAMAGTHPVPLILTGWSGRWMPGAGASDGPQFAGWDQGKAVSAAPEEPVVFSESVDDLTLQGIQVSIYRRADVLRFLEPDSAGELDTLVFLHRNANAKGRASIPAPLEPGRYVVEVVGSWLTPCMGLETYSPFSLDVH